MLTEISEIAHCLVCVFVGCDAVDDLIRHPGVIQVQTIVCSDTFNATPLKQAVML